MSSIIVDDLDIVSDDYTLNNTMGKLIFQRNLFKILDLLASMFEG
jgi:hypothetical protein